MPTRKEIAVQTRKTRQLLIESALELTSESGFASVSLRSVARRAGIAATSFYRHFRDMDELGVELVMEVEGVLYECLARINTTCSSLLRNAELQPDAQIRLGMICASDTFLRTVDLNRDLFRFFSQAYTGSSDRIRKAVVDLLRRFEADFEAYLREAAGLQDLEPARLALASQAVIRFLLIGGIELVPRDSDPEEIKDRLDTQIQIYLCGARQWNAQTADQEH